MSLNENMLHKTPKFEFARLAYYREENDGYITIRSKMHPQATEIILNETSKDIINFCDGSKDIKSVVEEMIKLYSGATEDLVLSDIIKCLEEFNRMKLISWKDEDPFFNNYVIDLDQSYRAYLCSFDNRDKTFEFMKKSVSNTKDKNEQDYMIYVNPYVSEDSFSRKQSYQRLLDNSEKTFAVERTGVQEGLACFSVNHDTAICNLLYTIINKECKCTHDFLSYMFQTIPLISGRTITGYRFFEEITNPISTKYMKMFKTVGFTFTGTLKDELGYGEDINQYDLIFESGDQ